MNASNYFSEVTDPRVTGSCLHLLSVKGNQKSLYEDIECAFKVNGGLEKDTSVDKDHGRIEVWKCRILPAREYLLAETIQSWRGLGTVIKIESSREINGKTTYETRYYISDEIGLSASYFQKQIRGHWSILSARLPLFPKYTTSFEIF